ncbi:polysaccharide biosynthesis tyrosine autokinase [Frigoribacterium sp. 2-23]|uniref:polysaccharide biosynthesis tyrosine autokinase n=1 Tax=Frigoribacterium sp. 2-23 TaxID=3415006 RepID=UPI003C6FFE39
MQVIDIVRALLRGWYILVIGAVLGAAGGYAVSAAATPTYVSSTEVFVAVRGQTESTAGEIASGSNAAQQKIKTYTGLVLTPRILSPVIERLELDTTPTELARQISASSPTGSVIMRISVTDTDPVAAAAKASAVTTTLIDVVTEQLEPEVSPGVPSVSIEVVTPAVEPTTPATPRTLANIGLGVLLGVSLGAVIAVLRRVLDTKIRDRDDLQTEGDLPVVGEIAFDAQTNRRPLIVRDDAGSPRAESFRSLRTNIQFLSARTGPRTFAITSSVPSEGKTTTTANLAIALSDTGARTVVVDADMRRPSLARTMGLEGAVGLSDVLIGRVELDDALQIWGDDGLVVLPAGTVPPNPSELLGSPAMQALVVELGERFDVVLIDTPPLLSVTDAAVISQLVSGLLLVVAAGRTTHAQLSRAIDSLGTVGTVAQGVVLTMIRRTREHAYYYEYVEAPARPTSVFGRRRAESGAHS